MPRKKNIFKNVFLFQIKTMKCTIHIRNNITSQRKLAKIGLPNRHVLTRQLVICSGRKKHVFVMSFVRQHMCERTYRCVFVCVRSEAYKGPPL